MTTNTAAAPMRAEIRALMADVFDMAADALPAEASPDNTPGWDSLSHMALIAALEKRYGLTIPHADAVELLGDAEIADYLHSKGVESGVSER